ncbi:MAG: PEP-CTERM sorting domain-containing protein [Acidobacteriia bacterium]|nr:PEP-CTERM sorting domain-containing protein [Terriglobia bacterium]
MTSIYAGGVAIPEPASLALLGAALLGLSKLLRKKLRRS